MKNNRRSLYRQIVTLIIVAVLVPLGVVSGVSYYTISKDIKNNFEAISNGHL